MSAQKVPLILMEVYFDEKDPNFVAAEARRRLHFVLPGEVGYVTLGGPAAAAGATAPGTPTGTWYTTLWGALQEADDHAATATAP